MKVNVRAYDNIDRIEVTAELQQYFYGDWITLNTYTPSNNDFYLLWEGVETVDKGYDYRLFSTIKVYEKSGSDFVLQETIERFHEATYK